jgi:hypothetical protein
MKKFTEKLKKLGKKLKCAISGHAYSEYATIHFIEKIEGRSRLYTEEAHIRACKRCLVMDEKHEGYLN